MVNRKSRNNPENYVYHILSKRDYSEGEIRHKLSGKFDIEKERIDGIISKLKNYDLINDNRYKRLYCVTKLRQGYGPFYISAKLAEKMINTSPDEVEKIALAENLDLEDIARKVCRNRAKNIFFKKTDRNKDNYHSVYNIYKKCFDFLCRRGFDIELSRRIAKEETEYESDFS